MSTDVVERVTPFALLEALERRVHTGSMALTATTSEPGAPQHWDGLAFRLRQHWCVVAAAEVREVLPVPVQTRLPGARGWLSGLANVRGVILPLVDLGAFFGLQRIAVQPLARVLILHSAKEPVGFLVDEAAGQRRFAGGEQRHEALAPDSPEATRLPPALVAHALGAFERSGVLHPVLGLKRLAASEAFGHGS